jgi:multimeric flavodoxin WrbA/putative sterol carrier protein
MKQIPHPLDVMKIMHQYIAGAYKDLDIKEKGIIQFCLKEKTGDLDFFLDADGNEMYFHDGISSKFNVKIECTLSDWLALAGKKLNPVIGVIFRRLKFTGETTYFKRLIPKELYKVDLSAYKDSITEFEKHPVKTWKKPRKVLLLDSSPRGSKGYTSTYCDQIEKFIKEKDVEVNRVVLSQYNIQHCLGCLQCWLKRDGECILKDDVGELYRMYEEADLIIYAFPLYAYGVPGLLKNFIDRGVMRQYQYFEKGISEIRHPRRVKKNQAFMVFSICGFPSFSQYDSVKPFFKLYSHSSHSPLVAEIYRPGGIFLLQNPFQYLKLQQFLNGLREAVHQAIDYGRVKRRTMRKINVKIDEKEFLKSTNKYWDNLSKKKDVNY